MRKQKGILQAIWGALAMLIIILDGKTALLSAQTGIALCLQTVIPSLFPFFVLSGIVSSGLLGMKIPLLRPIGRMCRIPEGSESLLLLGLIAGYPLGAQLIADSAKRGVLSAKDACRMLGFCCNAGPAFLFGMLSPLFSQLWMTWVLWITQILSALLVGVLLPGSKENMIKLPRGKQLTITESLAQAVKNMAVVSGWVVIFRVIIGFFSRWFLWLFPGPVQAMLSGLLELSNGCVLLSGLPAEGMRFVLAGTILSFGGICVWMQTRSVTGNIGIGWYLPGKILQSFLSFLMCFAVQLITFPLKERWVLPSAIIGITFVITILLLYTIHRKLGVEKTEVMMYNKGNTVQKEISYVVSQRY